MFAMTAVETPQIGIVERPVLPTYSRAEWLALRVVQVGAIAVVLVASTHRAFDLDRFLVPKELVLHATALFAGLLTLRRRVELTRVDAMLALYVLLGAVSVALATNPWAGVRALAVSASGVVLFFAGRRLREAGLAGPLVSALAFAVALCAVTSLLQAYGLRLDVFALNRSPGGTLGNRNFVAHAAAFGFPLIVLAAMRGGRFALPGVTLVTAALVLTRSRAAWLAFGSMALVFVLALIVAPALRRDGGTWRRLIAVLLFLGAGVAAALLLPNTLRWRSDTPYLDSVRDVANYQEGSGRGRLIQYQRSLIMAARAPLLGVGPGNWPVVYPAHAARRDPSLDPGRPGMTYNPWPSSDWVAFAAERGLPAFALLALAFLTLASRAVQQLRSTLDAEDSLLAVACVATAVAAVIAGAFDAVLLLGLPTLIVWTALGALSPRAAPGLVPRPRRWVAVLLIAVSALGATRSAAQLTAIHIYATRGDRASLELASRIDPGNYALHQRLARSGKREQRRAHARAARALFPNAGRVND
jgi:O-antigen ligase